MARWNLVIDLKRCNGCQACVVACKAENMTAPGIKWDWVLDRERGTYPKSTREFLPMLCMHCNKPPCVPVCPTGASRQRADGIVWNHYETCIGCGLCIDACPYNARYLYEEKESYWGGKPTSQESIDPALVGVQTPREETVQKCTFCMHRIDGGFKAGLKPGIDWAATPACVNACVTGARIFGDSHDPNSEVSQLLKSDRGTSQIYPEQGTDPKVYYLDR